MNHPETKMRIRKTKSGFTLYSKNGKTIWNFDKETQELLYDFLSKEKEKELKKTHPLRHTVVMKFSDMTHKRMAMIMKIENQEISGILQEKVNKKH